MESIQKGLVLEKAAYLRFYTNVYIMHNASLHILCKARYIYVSYRGIQLKRGLFEKNSIFILPPSEGQIINNLEEDKTIHLKI